MEKYLRFLKEKGADIAVIIDTNTIITAAGKIYKNRITVLFWKRSIFGIKVFLKRKASNGVFFFRRLNAAGNMIKHVSGSCHCLFDNNKYLCGFSHI